MANNEYPDAKQQKAAFHQGLNCLIFRKRSMVFLMKSYHVTIIIYIYIYIYIKDHPDFIVCSFVANSIGHKRARDSR